MKKLNLLLAVLIGLSTLSCSSDDENTMSQDVVIGIWKPIKVVEVYKVANDVTYEASSCYQKSRITFASDGSYNQQIFSENKSGNCAESNSSNFISGTWSKTSDNQYTFKIIEYNDKTQQNEIFTGDHDEITFPDQNTMIIKFIDGRVYNGNMMEYYYDEYSRVK